MGDERQELNEVGGFWTVDFAQCVITRVDDAPVYALNVIKVSPGGDFDFVCGSQSTVSSSNQQ